ncbi:unnamed protein product, partial [marine sediment metagenome]
FFEKMGIEQEEGREILLELARCLSPGFGQREVNSASPL